MVLVSVKPLQHQSNHYQWTPQTSPYLSWLLLLSYSSVQSSAHQLPLSFQGERQVEKLNVVLIVVLVHVVSVSVHICMKMYCWNNYIHVYSSACITFIHAICQTICAISTQYFHYTIDKARSVPDNLSCSENVVYDAVGDTLKMSTQAKLACLETLLMIMP